MEQFSMKNPLKIMRPDVFALVLSGSLTVDRVLNEKLEHLKDKSADSVWNFHTFIESKFFSVFLLSLACVLLVFRV